ncbi:hypothetical protein [Plantactinospora sp. GCM10030261]|uniref:hypothetical protein n=1 Tax=Plantactinospora sp. GCM10030261 TaxID=3273420 RepID=UPI00360FBBDC
MTTTTIAYPRTRARRLGGRTRKTVLLTHILAAGVWLGLDAAMAVLVFTAVGTDDQGTRGFALQALELVTVWPMFVAGALSLATGILLGLGGKYGLVRYWWVLVKLVLNIVLCLLVLFALRTGVAEAAATGRALAAGAGITWTPGDIVFPPIVSPAALLVAYVLSVFKPWGRVMPPAAAHRSPGGPAAAAPARGRSAR